jgi:hypothetical protein
MGQLGPGFVQGMMFCSIEQSAGSAERTVVQQAAEQVYVHAAVIRVYSDLQVELPRQTPHLMTG